MKSYSFITESEFTKAIAILDTYSTHLTIANKDNDNTQLAVAILDMYGVQLAACLQDSKSIMQTLL